MTEREFQTIIDKLDSLENKVIKVDQDNQLLSEKLELYREEAKLEAKLLAEKLELYQKVSQEKLEAFQEANKQQIEANRQQIQAFQEANKQQLNVSLGVLVTAAVTILASVILGMSH
ncbi:conserved hypothetical protein [Rippkaea orientalis PCC 8801]|uniref:Uncharacterized protein n=1 Tax=Rippkaea orientalis (strain PCC 8801 / RF-1) TaxID=41431 RepID=B7K670_RIPO1|nr:hypothetical protein [Rippkaea orientalis]ACK68123.1 conserved hypothetical protein [Rippkaea orientalis PCC 8801]